MSDRMQASQTMTAARPGRESGFTLVEMLIATLVVVIGLVAVAQLVPTSMMMNANNRSDGTALVIAQKQMEALRAVPLTTNTFTDPLGVTCPPSTTCFVGDPNQPGLFVGSPVVPFNNSPVIDFAQASVAGYSYTYTDPNDPFGAVNDVRWAVVTTVNGTSITGKRFFVGVRQLNGSNFVPAVTLDAVVDQ